MIKSTKTQYLFWAILALSVTACTKSPSNSTPYSAQNGSNPGGPVRQTVTISAAAGGYVSVGGMQLAIPANSLQSDTTITAELVDYIPAPADTGKLGKGIRFEPDGLQFINPVELRICYGDAAGLDEQSTLIYYHASENEPVGITGTVDAANHCVSGHIEHFSSYIAAARQIQGPGNPAPQITGVNFMPGTPLAGIPLRVRVLISDRNLNPPPGTGLVTGIVASAFLNYRTSAMSDFKRVPLQPDTTVDTEANRYFYLIPANEVTTGQLEYFFEATDNLNKTTTTATVPRQITETANEMQIVAANNAGSNLTIASGFTRSLTLQARDSTATPPTWHNISAENFNLSNASLGTLQRTSTATVRFNASGSGVGTISALAGSLTATFNTAVIPGLLNRIALTDLNHIEITAPVAVRAGQTIDLDAVGYDGFGNTAIIRPQITANGGIGSVTVDLLGAHFTASTTPGSGTISAMLSNLSSTIDINVYIAPAVLTTVPIDTAFGVSRGTTITVVFTKVMDTGTLYAATDGTCTGSIQVSRDNFVTCVAMQSPTPLYTAGETTAILTPAGLLRGRSTYQVRVTDVVRDNTGYTMIAPYTSDTGFLTLPDLSPPQVIATLPLSNATGVSYASPLSVTFDHSMNAATITTTNMSLTCNSQPIPIVIGLQNENMTALISPQVFLPAVTGCSLSVSTGVQSDENIPMAAPFVLNFTTGSAPTASLVREVDIVQQVNSPMFTTAAGKVFFVAQVPSLGKELWASDGTFSNTQQVKDIYMGLNSADPDFLTAADQKIFFVAENGVHGRELWKSDGTLAGTLMVKDIRPGPDSSNISGLCVIDGIVYFSADDGIYGQELWKSDGTEAGTVMIKDINPNALASNPGMIFANGTTALFTATDGTHGYELWKTDGTSSGTILVKDIQVGSGSSYPKNFGALGNVVFFAANDGLAGEELWKSDGTETGTVLVSDIAPGTASSYPEKNVLFNGRIYFMADDNTIGKELWSTDGSATLLVKDLTSGMSSSFVEILLATPSGIYLVNHLGGTYHLWHSDGSSAGTIPLANFSQPVNRLFPWNGRVYFSGFAAPTGNEPWSTNGTALGTALVQNIKAGATSSNPVGFGGFNSTLFFRISDPFSAFPAALWKYE